jgi:hypothetical protein
MRTRTTLTAVTVLVVSTPLGVLAGSGRLVPSGQAQERAADTPAALIDRTRLPIAPFTWTKQIAGSYGGCRDGMIAHWPKKIMAKGGILT